MTMTPDQRKRTEQALRRIHGQGQGGDQRRPSVVVDASTLERVRAENAANRKQLPAPEAAPEPAPAPPPRGRSAGRRGDRGR